MKENSYHVLYCNFAPKDTNFPSLLYDPRPQAEIFHKTTNHYPLSPYWLIGILERFRYFKSSASLLTVLDLFLYYKSFG